MMRTVTRRLHALAPLLISAAMVWGSAAAAESLDEIYAKAKAEQSLVLYAGGPQAIFEAMAKRFESRYPGIKVAVSGGFSNVLNQRIEQQIKAGKLEVDLGLFQTVQDFVNWDARGLLLHYKPDGFDKIYPAFRDNDGAYMSWFVTTLSYAYNTKLVKSEDVPKSALDFLKPMFKGKIIACYPHDDDATLYAFDTIVKKYGWSYMDKFMANQPTFVQGHLSVARAVASGEALVTFDASVSTAGGLQRAKQPIGLAFSETDQVPVFSSTAGIFKAAPHPNAAKLFLAWLLMPQQQAGTRVFSSRSDVPPPAGFKPLLSYNVANGYREFITDAAKVAELRKRFEAYTGPVRNKGGVR
jgi:ABC-type Fe3+ transport system substrate-binding protein